MTGGPDTKQAPPLTDQEIRVLLLKSYGLRIGKYLHKKIQKRMKKKMAFLIKCMLEFFNNKISERKSHSLTFT